MVSLCQHKAFIIPNYFYQSPSTMSVVLKFDLKNLLTDFTMSKLVIVLSYHQLPHKVVLKRRGLL